MKKIKVVWGEDKSWQSQSKKNMLKFYSKADAIYDLVNNQRKNRHR